MNIVFSFFSGGGLWDYSISKYFRIAHTNEINKEFYKGYSSNNDEPFLGSMNFDFKELLINKNLNKFIKKEIKLLQKDFYVGFIGGSPCIDFSIAGNNLGNKGSHGNLFTLFIDFILDQKPDFFIIENVPNLIQGHKEYFKNQYIKLSYDYNCNFSKLNALEFGVPQNRSRVFIYGVKKSIKPILNIDFNNYKKYNINYLMKLKWPKYEEFKENEPKQKPDDIPDDLTIEYWIVKNTLNHPNQNDFYCNSQHKNINIGEGQRITQKICRFHRYRYAYTLCFGTSVDIPGHPYIRRSISVAEALSIQSMPKEFILTNMSLCNKYRVISNGVPYLLGNAVGKAMNDFLN